MILSANWGILRLGWWVSPAVTSMDHTVLGMLAPLNFTWQSKKGTLYYTVTAAGTLWLSWMVNSDCTSLQQILCGCHRNEIQKLSIHGGIGSGKHGPIEIRWIEQRNCLIQRLIQRFVVFRYFAFNWETCLSEFNLSNSIEQPMISADHNQNTQHNTLHAPLSIAQNML